MKIVEDLLPKSKYPLKAPYPMVPEYITVHNTWNDAPAVNEVTYMKNNSSQTGFHTAIDNIEVRHAIPYDRNAYHAGDGAKGDGNRKSIGIEICYSKSGGKRYQDAEANAIEYIASLLIKYNWGIERVKTHKSWSGKNCPHRILDEKRWDSFTKSIQSKVKELKGGNGMTKVFTPGIKALIDSTDIYLSNGVKDKLIDKSHLDDFRAGKMTTDRLLGLKIKIDDARRGGR